MGGFWLWVCLSAGVLLLLFIGWAWFGQPAGATDHDPDFDDGELPRRPSRPIMVEEREPDPEPAPFKTPVDQSTVVLQPVAKKKPAKRKKSARKR